jgi:hypothetical protein
MNGDLNLTPPPPPHEAQLASLRARTGWIVQAIRVGLVMVMLLALAYGCYSMFHIERMEENILRFLKVDATAAPKQITPVLTGFIMVNWVSLGLLLAAGWRLADGYLRGEIFTARSVRRLRILALVGLTRSLCFIVPSHYLLAVTMTGERLSWRTLAFALPPNILQWTLFFCFMLVLAAVFKVAAEIADEHKHFA